MAIKANFQHNFQSQTIVFHREDDSRRDWRQKRSMMEWKYQKSKRYMLNRFLRWNLMPKMEHLFEYGLKAVGVHERGFRNAKNLVINHIGIRFPDLPPSFDNYTILHLTDPHFDARDGFDDIICEKIKDLKVDLCVLTGDYRRKIFGEYEQVLAPMKRMVDAVNAGDGILATLGNHDTYLLLDFLEGMGITVLVNETASIWRGKEKIFVTGLDDPHNYYTEQARHALEEAVDGFKIALVHSPELYDLAAENGYRLYFCGHTHGGQICLPGGIPLVTHLRRGKRFVRGLWEFDNMIGYTNQGCGVVGIPVRFNTQSEVTLITLNPNPDKPEKLQVN